MGNKREGRIAGRLFCLLCMFGRAVQGTVMSIGRDITDCSLQLCSV
ncbi:MAG: hypothetical protein JXK07_05045 [Spirochaetes bacterium]|nr:hypothetical protein [Spirochaetota bacterium]